MLGRRGLERIEHAHAKTAALPTGLSVPASETRVGMRRGERAVLDIQPGYAYQHRTWVLDIPPGLRKGDTIHAEVEVSMGGGGEGLELEVRGLRLDLASRSGGCDLQHSLSPCSWWRWCRAGQCEQCWQPRIHLRSRSRRGGTLRPPGLLIRCAWREGRREVLGRGGSCLGEGERREIDWS